MGQETPQDPVTLNWTQTIEHARHWETLIFEQAKNYFTLFAASLGASGVVMASTSLPRTTQISVIYFFLIGAGIVATFAIITISSTHRYLLRLYVRRRELEKVGGLKLMADDASGGSRTIRTVKIFFLGAIILAACLLGLLTWSTTEIARLNLSGVDLSLARNLTQSDLKSACGDGTTKLPPGFSLSPCK